MIELLGRLEWRLDLSTILFHGQWSSNLMRSRIELAQFSITPGRR